MRHVISCLLVCAMMSMGGLALADDPQTDDQSTADLAPIKPIDDLATRDNRDDLALPRGGDDVAWSVPRDDSALDTTR